MLKNKNLKVSTYFLYALLGLIGVVLLFFLILYLAAPSYRFNETKPFSGALWNNPYQNLSPENLLRCNLHATDEQELSQLDYDLVVTPGKMKLDVKNATEISAYQHGYGMLQIQQLCYGAEKVNYVDYPFSQNMSLKQHVINKLKSSNRLVALAHPQYPKAYKMRDMANLNNYQLMEVINPYGTAFEYWDEALSNGHRVFLLASSYGQKQLPQYFTMVEMKEKNAETLFQALESGQSYGVDLHLEAESSLDEVNAKLLSMPFVTRAELVADTLFVAASAPPVSMQFVGQNGKNLKSSTTPEQFYYVLQPTDTYVRVAMQFADNSSIYLNPLTRYDDSDAEPSHTDTIDGVRTWMMRIVYLSILALMIYIIKKPNDPEIETKH